ncbi:AAA family ATPase [Candidatus Falkowbacteria bacterium]|jgi:dephospho-CoA kinase|nr:AAA family ATPase [Candidatus Falkowbacteria bacterium]MBT4432757.1 AAA family ATPase [Candidatus Falkowbacteria bacterium]
MKNKKIFAVVGMTGSGKTEVVKYLQKKLDCGKIYFGEITFERMKREKIEVSYKNEQIMREKIRAEKGMGAYAELSLLKIKKALKENDVVVVESLYSWSEYKIIKEKYPNNFQVIAVHASPKIRFLRLKNRKNERPMKTRKEFITRDFSEIENIEKGGPIARADYMIVNEGSLKKLYAELDKILCLT